MSIPFTGAAVLVFAASAIHAACPNGPLDRSAAEVVEVTTFRVLSGDPSALAASEAFLCEQDNFL